MGDIFSLRFLATHVTLLVILSITSVCVAAVAFPEFLSGSGPRILGGLNAVLAFIGSHIYLSGEKAIKNGGATDR